MLLLEDFDVVDAVVLALVELVDSEVMVELLNLMKSGQVVVVLLAEQE